MIVKRKTEDESSIYVETDIWGRGIVFPPITINFYTFTPQKLISELVRRTYIPDLTCSDTYMSLIRKDGSFAPIQDLYRAY